MDRKYSFKYLNNPFRNLFGLVTTYISFWTISISRRKVQVNEIKFLWCIKEKNKKLNDRVFSFREISDDRRTTWIVQRNEISSFSNERKKHKRTIKSRSNNLDKTVNFLRMMIRLLVRQINWTLFLIAILTKYFL